jgi:hypothetical protein
MDQHAIYDYLRDNLSITIDEESEIGGVSRIVVCLRLRPPDSKIGFTEATIISKDYVRLT